MSLFCSWGGSAVQDSRFREISDMQTCWARATNKSLLTHPLGNDATSVLWADHPVVVLQGVHGLQNGRHTTDVGVDLSVIDKLGCQVTVELGLHLSHKVHKFKLYSCPPGPQTSAQSEIRAN